MGASQNKAIPHVNLPNHHGWIPNVIKEYDVKKSRVVNEYKSLDRLGKGGHGMVFKVEHQSTRAIYALKYIPIDMEGDAEKAAREAEVMKKLSHNSIVRFHSSFLLYDQDQGVHDPIAYCIIMDFVDGPDLRDYMMNYLRHARQLPKNYVMECFIKIAEALNYMHRLQIYHYDLKPENIIVSQCHQGVNVTLIDFGSAVMHSGPKVPLKGTIVYWAPELHRSHNVALDGKADMWALGCILYEIWTQDSSFMTELCGMATSLGKMPKLINELEEWSIVQLLSELLHRDPAKRISAADLIRSDIFRGWRVAIDESHTERSRFHKSPFFLFPFVTVLNFPAAPPTLYLSNLQYISQGLGIKGFHQVFVEFKCSLSLIRFLSHSPESDSAELALKVLAAVLEGDYGTTLAHQICANPIGIATLLKRKGYNEIAQIMRFSFGHATLKRSFAVESRVSRMLRSDAIENIQSGIALYEALPTTNVPLTIYLDKMQENFGDPSLMISCLGNLLNNHKDMSVLLNEQANQQMEKLLWRCLSFPHEHTGKLLLGLLLTVKSRTWLSKCINHRVCTAEVMGAVKFSQYAWYCEKCDLNVCVGCARNCHIDRGCKGGYFYQGTVSCKCGEWGCCKCVRHSFDDGSPLQGSMRRMQRVSRHCIFHLLPLTPAPYIEEEHDSLVSYWEELDEIRLPPNNSPDEKSRHRFLNKGFVLQTRSAVLSTVFYYEIEIVTPPVGKDAHVSMGVVLHDKIGPNFFSRPSGLVDGEYGYHGHDGYAYYCSKDKKVPAPLYSTGDRIGCGVMSDGVVYFTLNGMWLGCPPEDLSAPKIASRSKVFSVVTTTGFDGHVKFFFEPSTLMFVPCEPEFQVGSFFKREPYCHLDLVHAAFGRERTRIFGLIKSVDVDLGASLLHALCYNNSSLAREISEIFPRFTDSDSRFARKMMDLIYEIRDARPETRKSSVTHIEPLYLAEVTTTPPITDPPSLTQSSSTPSPSLSPRPTPSSLTPTSPPTSPSPTPCSSTSIPSPRYLSPRTLPPPAIPPHPISSIPAPSSPTPTFTQLSPSPSHPILSHSMPIQSPSTQPLSHAPSPFPPQASPIAIPPLPSPMSPSDPSPLTPHPSTPIPPSRFHRIPSLRTTNILSEPSFSTPISSTPTHSLTTPSPTFSVPSTPSTTAPSTQAPCSPVPHTQVPSTQVPSTQVPSTHVPSTPIPSTPIPSTPIPSTPIPSTPIPSTPIPSTPVPSIPVPSIPVPSTHSPPQCTPCPLTPPSLTLSPPTPSPSTLSPPSPYHAPSPFPLSPPTPLILSSTLSPSLPIPISPTSTHNLPSPPLPLSPLTHSLSAGDPPPTSPLPSTTPTPAHLTLSPPSALNLIPPPVPLYLSPLTTSLYPATGHLSPSPLSSPLLSSSLSSSPLSSTHTHSPYRRWSSPSPLTIPPTLSLLFPMPPTPSHSVQKSEISENRSEKLEKSKIPKNLPHTFRRQPSREITRTEPAKL